MRTPDNRAPGQNSPDQLTPGQMFQRDVQQYLDGHIYPGFTAPFQLEGISTDEQVKRARPDAQAKVVILRGLEEEDIGTLDRDWREGLMQVGVKWETELRLPSWYFER